MEERIIENLDLIVKISARHVQNNGSHAVLGPKGLEYLEDSLSCDDSYRLEGSNVWNIGGCSINLKIGTLDMPRQPPFEKDVCFLGCEIYGELIKARELYGKVSVALNNACGTFDMGFDEPEEAFVKYVKRGS